MNGSLCDIFKEDLLKDENILWVGQPETSVIFTKNDKFPVPFSIIFGGFSISWEATALSMVGKSKPGAIYPFLCSSVLVLFGAYFIFGRFIYKHLQKKRTYYAVTDKRGDCLE